ncbi:hypothetical protein TEQG_02317 [Trichophyton equinum CBS 127.97]|uniref:Secreted protein n=1 Tax=Trichophyton equinum (strain ATCC MYA-4606 / CBS 127.97) TaxID=559882 RepID=F2PN15_TRIEC|nr:hypothetical protein TEQG_02317 [Trichophyton equinum CBS 127.97]
MSWNSAPGPFLGLTLALLSIEGPASVTIRYEKKLYGNFSPPKRRNFAAKKKLPIFEAKESACRRLWWGGQVADQLEGGPHEKQSWVQYKETSPIDHIGRAGK